MLPSVVEQRVAREKMDERKAWGNWDPLEGYQPFQPTINGARVRTTMFRPLLIGAETWGSKRSPLSPS